MWWESTEFYGELEGALVQINSADSEIWPDELARTRPLFDALNSLLDSFRRAVHNLTLTHVDALVHMVTSELSISDQEWLVQLPEVAQLVGLRHPILDRDVLRRSPDYSPQRPIPPELAANAGKKHRQLAEAFAGWQAAPSESALRTTTEWLARVLFVVRSNMLHGERTFHGPDLAKAERDRQGTVVVERVLRALLSALLAFPDACLAAYGTLAPGQANSAMLSMVEGTWLGGTVDGVRFTANGFPAFAWRRGEGRVRVQVLRSAALREHWARLDEFEGGDYHRILVPVTLSNGGILVASLYEYRGIG